MATYDEPMAAADAYEKLRVANPDLPANVLDCTILLEPDSIATAIVRVPVRLPDGLNALVETVSDDSMSEPRLLTGCAAAASSQVKAVTGS